MIADRMEGGLVEGKIGGEKIKARVSSKLINGSTDRSEAPVYKTSDRQQTCFLLAVVIPGKLNSQYEGPV